MNSMKQQTKRLLAVVSAMAMLVAALPAILLPTASAAVITPNAELP